MSVEGRDGDGGENKELLTKLVLSILLTTTEEVLISVRVATVQAVRLQRKKCVMLIYSNCEHLTLLTTRRICSVLSIHKGHYDYILLNSGYYKNISSFLEFYFMFIKTFPFFSS